ncbi:hypothetical protein MMC13_007168 [Lambiella insularis]|nr:hypothetical protein [Lambiella insularis]
MQIAEILSDLTSLRACEYEAAIALVSSYQTLDSDPHASSSTPQKYLDEHSTEKKSDASTRPRAAHRTSLLEYAKDDPDLQRAIDLVDLHYGVKEKHKNSVDMSLQKARQDVQRMMEGMHRTQIIGQRGP